MAAATALPTLPPSLTCSTVSLLTLANLAAVEMALPTSMLSPSFRPLSLPMQASPAAVVTASPISQLSLRRRQPALQTQASLAVAAKLHRLLRHRQALTLASLSLTYQRELMPASLVEAADPHGRPLRRRRSSTLSLSKGVVVADSQTLLRFQAHRVNPEAVVVPLTQAKVI